MMMSPCGYLESFQSGLMLAAVRKNRAGSAGLVQSYSSELWSPASLSIMGEMLMAEPSMEGVF